MTNRWARMYLCYPLGVIVACLIYPTPGGQNYRYNLSFSAEYSTVPQRCLLHIDVGQMVVHYIVL